MGMILFQPKPFYSIISPWSEVEAWTQLDLTHPNINVRFLLAKPQVSRAGCRTDVELVGMEKELQCPSLAPWVRSAQGIL